MTSHPSPLQALPTMITALRAAVAGLLCAAAWCSAAPAEGPIKIGMIVEGIGANAEFGVRQLRGAQLAVEEVNKAGGVLGRPLELEAEDNQSTNPGSVFAFLKIVERGEAVAVIGTMRSTQTLAMMPSILKAGVPTMVGGTDYVLTHAGNPWVFRARPNDDYSARLMARFGVETLKRKRWAIVHSTETFGIGGKARLIEALQALGIRPVTVQPIGHTATHDLPPAIQAIKQSNADIVATYIAVPADAAAFATQMGQQGVTATLIGTASMVADISIQPVGAALPESYAVVDFAVESSPEAQSFADRYKARFGRDANHSCSWTYDAVHLLALAIRNANSTQPADVRKALLAIRGHKGAEGTHSYDTNGDGLHGYNVVRNEHGKLTFVKHVSFD